MPMIGWLCVRAIAEQFTAFQKFIPWIALVLLLYIGGKMIIESLLDKSEECKACKKKSCQNCAERKTSSLAFGLLILQGIATSIDALSVGFATARYDALMALVSSLIIAGVTFAICMAGLLIGRAAGKRLSSRAQILGGAILIFIGLEIFVRGLFF